MMQFASSLDPNADGSYNPLRTYADLLNFVFNGLFVVELAIRFLSSYWCWLLLVFWFDDGVQVFGVVLVPYACFEYLCSFVCSIPLPVLNVYAPLSVLYHCLMVEFAAFLSLWCLSHIEVFFILKPNCKVLVNWIHFTTFHRVVVGMFQSFPPFRQYVCAVVEAVLRATMENFRPANRHIIPACPNPLGQHTFWGICFGLQLFSC